MTSDYTTPPRADPSSLRRRAVRVVSASGGQATAEDIVLDHAEAIDRFGADVAALIFDDQRPGALDLTYRTAALRYGAPAAALIFPAGTQAPAVDDDNDATALVLPLVGRVVS